MVAAAGGRLFHAVPPRHSIGWGLLLVAAGTALCMLVGPESGWTVLVPGLCVTGVGVGLSTPVLASAALAVAPPDRAGMASGASNTFRQLGYALALPVFATVVAGRAAAVLSGSGDVAAPDAAARQLTGGGYEKLLDRVPGALLRTAYAAGLDRIFLFSALLATVGGLAVLALLRTPAPAEPSPGAAGDPEPVAAGAGGADRTVRADGAER